MDVCDFLDSVVIFIQSSVAIVCRWFSSWDANTVAATASALSALAAFWTVRRSEKSRREDRRLEKIRIDNQRLLSHAVITLERAYMALRGADEGKLYPPNDRINWLTSARLIIEYRRTKMGITDSLLLRECESHEDQWRYSFFILLKGLERLMVEGKISYCELEVNGRIRPASVDVILSFASWPEAKEDVLNTVDANDALAEFPGSDDWKLLRDGMFKLG